MTTPNTADRQGEQQQLQIALERLLGATLVADLLPYTHGMEEPDRVERYADLMRGSWWDWNDPSEPIIMKGRVLEDGSHRVLAAHMAGIKTVPVIGAAAAGGDRDGD